MILPTITIAQFRQQNPYLAVHYKNDMIVTDKVEYVERLRTPCRIKAITVLVCLGGEIHCTINLKDYCLSQDMILVVFPEDVIQIKDMEDLRAYALLLSTDFLNELNIDFRERSDFYLNVRRNAVSVLPHNEIIPLKPYYDLLCTNIKNARAESPEIIRGLVQAFSFSVISLMRLFRTDENHENETDRTKQLFNQFMALVQQYHASARGLRFYADKMCLTPNYLSGVIKNYTGKTAVEWVNEYVILEAKIMLKDSALSVQEIAYRLDFPTQSAFGKYFKKLVGVSPKQYRSKGYEE